jgi:hypothetical protein
MQTPTLKAQQHLVRRARRRIAVLGLVLQPSCSVRVTSSFRWWSTKHVFGHLDHDDVFELPGVYRGRRVAFSLSRSFETSVTLRHPRTDHTTTLPPEVTAVAEFRVIDFVA